jgi:DNA processing protein
MSLEQDLEQGTAVSVRRARAWLSRAAEPGTIDFWRYVDDVGAVDAVRTLRAGSAPDASARSSGSGPIRTRAWPT